MIAASPKLLLLILSRPRYLLWFIGSWFTTVTLFIWAINLNLLSYVLASPDLTASGKLTFILSAYGNYFRYIDNPIAFTSIIFSLLVAVNLTLLWYVWRETHQTARLTKQNSGALVAMLGAHCLSCGTSLIAPLISAFAGSGAFISAGRANVSTIFATAANTLGIILIMWSISKVMQQVRGNRLHPVIIK